MKEKIRKHFEFTVHNMIGHPISEVLHLVGLSRLSEWVHDATLPKGANQ